MVAGMFTRILIHEYPLLAVKASFPKKIAATKRVPRSLARLVEIVFAAKPQTMTAYASPIVNGALVGETNGLAGSKTAQMMKPRKASTMNSWKKRKPWFVWFGLGKLQRMLAAPPLKLW